MRVTIKCLFLLLMMPGCCFGNNHIKSQQEKPYAHMSDSSRYSEQAAGLAAGLKRKGITDRRILEAIAGIPRHRFVEERLSGEAYQDKPLSIGKGQTISQPYTVAFQTELLGVKAGERVLEIGTGSGYQAAVLCELGAKVYSIERIYELHVRAKDLLTELGYTPVLVYGDGYEGLPREDLFDKILVTAAAKELPEKLLKQLRVGGWMVVPMGDDFGQKMMVVKRTGENRYVKSEHGLFRFVPMLKGTEK